MTTISASCTLLCFLATGCLVSRDEVARVRSPSGDLDAVVYEINGGATTSFGHDVYIVPAKRSIFWGIRAAHFYRASRNERASGVNVVWSSPDILMVRYLEANSAVLESDRALRVAGRAVFVGLEGGVNDPKACPGGMLHDLMMSNIRGPDCGIASR